MEHKWWNQVRYLKIGKLIASRLSVNKDLKTSLRKMFKEHNDQLSYHDLFQFFETSQKQGGLELNLAPWEESMMEDRLDQLGMAFIEFNEFNEFCLDYGLDWGEEINDNDLEAILEAKLNLSYKDY